VKNRTAKQTLRAHTFGTLVLTQFLFVLPQFVLRRNEMKYRLLVDVHACDSYLLLQRKRTRRRRCEKHTVTMRD
jgi:hypothetical protein